MHNYDHWFSDNPFNSKKEMEVISEKHTPYPDLVLIARHEGVLLGLEAIQKGKIDPIACIFIDSPKKVKGVISGLELPILETSGKNISNLIKNSKLFLSKLD